MSLNLNEIQQKLDRLFQVMADELNKHFDLFFSPEPKDITLKRLDETGQLQDITVPNYAKISDAVNPVGSILLWSGGAVPPGFLPCDGTEKTAAEYPLLFELAKKGTASPQLPFAPGSDAGHFYLPTLTAPRQGTTYIIRFL